MKTDWKELVAVAGDHVGGTMGSLFSAVLIGLLVCIGLIVIYWKLGVFRRPNNTWYNIGVKLYIPYIVVVCLSIAVQCGFYRGVYRAVIAVNDAVVGELYARAIGPAIGSDASRQAFLSAAQMKAQGSLNAGQAITGMIKETLQDRLQADSSLSNKAVSGVANWFIDRYENDIATAVLYGLYLKSGDYVHAHAAGDPMEYHEFKEGADHLLKLDLTQVEAAIQGNLGILTHGLIESQYKSMVKGLLVVGAVLVLLPLMEWGIYLWVMRKRSDHGTIQPAGVVTGSEPPGPEA